jgi:CheY-like chemotaxis protein
MVSFPDLVNYRILLVDDRAETTEMIAALFAPAGVELAVAGAIDVAVRLISSLRPNVVMLATAIAGEPFAVVEAARDHGVPVLALDLGSAGPEISDRLTRTYGVAVLSNIDPEGLCHAAKRAADGPQAALDDGGRPRMAR